MSIDTLTYDPILLKDTCEIIDYKFNPLTVSFKLSKFPEQFKTAGEYLSYNIGNVSYEISILFNAPLSHISYTYDDKEELFHINTNYNHCGSDDSFKTNNDYYDTFITVEDEMNDNKMTLHFNSDHLSHFTSTLSMEARYYQMIPPHIIPHIRDFIECQTIIFENDPYKNFNSSSRHSIAQLPNFNDAEWMLSHVVKHIRPALVPLFKTIRSLLKMDGIEMGVTYYIELSYDKFALNQCLLMYHIVFRPVSVNGIRLYDMTLTKMSCLARDMALDSSGNVRPAHKHINTLVLAYHQFMSSVGYDYIEMPIIVESFSINPIDKNDVQCWESYSLTVYEASLPLRKGISEICQDFFGLKNESLYLYEYNKEYNSDGFTKFDFPPYCKTNAEGLLIEKIPKNAKSKNLGIIKWDKIKFTKNFNIYHNSKKKVTVILIPSTSKYFKIDELSKLKRKFARYTMGLTTFNYVYLNDYVSEYQPGMQYKLLIYSKKETALA